MTSTVVSPVKDEITEDGREGKTDDDKAVLEVELQEDGEKLKKEFFIHPRDSRWYKGWVQFMVFWAIYSSFFTPMEFGFFRGLPEHLYLLDILGQVAFVVDIFLQFFVAYRDDESESDKFITDRNRIAFRYLTSCYFYLDLLACVPWDNIYRASGRQEEVRYFLLIRLVRARKVLEFFSKLEKDINVNYFISRILKLTIVELYCTHTAACIFYYLATTLPASQEEYTWIGSLKLGDYSYSNFRDIDLWKRYITSLYFAIITMATVGYGDIHPVNLREMIFLMVYVSFDMVLAAYLVGSVTALVVKGSDTVIYRDKIKKLLKYMEKHIDTKDTQGLDEMKKLRNKIKDHLQSPMDYRHIDFAAFQDLPSSTRAIITESLYEPRIKKVPLFHGCSPEFIKQIAARVYEEFYSPPKVIMKQGSVVDHLYFIFDGRLEESVVREGGLNEVVANLEPCDSIGDVSIVCNIPQPHTVRVTESCLLLRLDKQSFSNILEIYIQDKRKILNNLLKAKERGGRMTKVVTDIKAYIRTQDAQLTLRLNSAAYKGELEQLKNLHAAGASLNKKNFDGRSPLHFAASKGRDNIIMYLINDQRVKVNVTDNFGNTPLLEAIKRGHDSTASLLIKEGGLLMINDDGSLLSTKDSDFQTPLHVAISRESYDLAKLLVDAGANVLSQDRWGKTPLDNAIKSGNEKLIKLLEEAKASQLSKSPSSSQEASVTDKMSQKKCTLYAFEPWDANVQNKLGVVFWVPDTINELMKTAADHWKLNLLHNSCIITEDAGQILDTDVITNGEKLYLINTQA